MAIEKCKNGRYRATAWDKRLGKKVHVGMFNTRRAAEAASRQAHDELLLGGELAVRKDITFGQLCDRYEGSSDNLRDATRSKNSAALLKAKAFFGEGASVRRVSREDVSRYVARLTRSHEPSTVHSYVRVLHVVFDNAIDWQFREDNPVTRLRNMPRNRRSDVEVLRPEDHARFVEKAPEHYKTMFFVWPFLGLRVGEMLGLSRRNVDLTAGRVRVRSQLTSDGTLDSVLKTDAAMRTVVVEDQAVLRELRLWKLKCPPSEDELVFPSPKGMRLNRGQLAKVWNKTATGAGIDGFTRHGMRHTFATWSLQTQDVRFVASQLGHGDCSVTLRTYAHLIAKEETATARKLGEWYRERVEKAVGE